jgi:hypothetical protein
MFVKKRYNVLRKKRNTCIIILHNLRRNYDSGRVVKDRLQNIINLINVKIVKYG